MKSPFDAEERKFFFIPFIFFLFILIAELIGILILNAGLIIYTTDDAYIHLALAENIFRGHYGVNLQENSSPSSSILWPFLVAPFAGFSLGKIVPLIINIFSSGGTVFIFFLVLKKIFLKVSSFKHAFSKVILLIMILLIIGTNLIGALFSGMEHSLQIFFSLLTIWGLISLVKQKNIPVWLLLVIIAAPLIRYENLALSFSSLGFLYFMGYKRKAVFGFIMIIVLVSGYSFFLVNLGLEPLPLSVFQKSSVVSYRSFNSAFENLMENILRPRGALLLAGSFILIYQAFSSKRKKEEKLLAGFFSLVVLLHLVFGKDGRYVVYLWAASLIVFIFLFRSSIIKVVLQNSFLKIAIVSSAFTILFSYYYILNIVTIPIASNNIYEQQYQMHRFVTEYFKKPVAVNDLGYVSFNNDNYVLDLVGLASEEVLNLWHTRKTSAWIDTLSRRHNVELAMIYDDWFDTIPESWYKVAELYLGKIKIAASRKEVSFYLLGKEKKEELIALLKDFKKTLPGGVRLEINE